MRHSWPVQQSPWHRWRSPSYSTRTGDPLIGSRFALSLAAVVVGGTILGCGRATLAGTVLGPLALGLLSNVLNLIGVPTFYQTAAKGIVLVAAILLPSLVARAVNGYRKRRHGPARLAAHLVCASARGVSR